MKGFYTASAESFVVYSFIFYACMWIIIEVVKLLIIVIILQGKRKPLWSASSNGIPEVVEALLDRGADINLTNEVRCVSQLISE